MPQPLLPHLRLVRLSDDGNQTLGVLEIYARETDSAPVARFFTLEPSWKNNQQRKSCVPIGRYRLERRTSAKYGLHLHLRGTEPERALVLIHAGNERAHTEGCILVGTGTEDLGRDGDLDVTGSRTALTQLMNLVSERGDTDATLEICGCLRAARSL
jgi:hypothetical protein